MKKKKKIIIAVVSIIIVICGVFGYMFYSDMKQEKILRDEILKVSGVNLMSKDIDMEIKTKGDYAIVEKTIKEYLSEYASLAKEIINKVEDKRYQQVLTIENIKKDAPNFVESEKTISELNGITERVDTMINMTSKDAVMKKIEEKHLDSYYNDLYDGIMFGSGTINQLDSVKNSLSLSNKKLKSLSNTYTEAINFLKSNKGKWEVSGNQLYFYSNDLVSKYNKIIASM